MSIAELVELKPNPQIPAQIAPGDTVKVSVKIVESGKERVQPFQGVVIRVRRSGTNVHFTVRRVTSGVGVERTFSIYSPMVQKVDIVRHSKVRRAKLYYLRELSGKAARLKEKRYGKEKMPELISQPEPVTEVMMAQPEESQAPAAPPATEAKETPAAARPAESKAKAAPAEAKAPPAAAPPAPPATPPEAKK